MTNRISLAVLPAALLALGLTFAKVASTDHEDDPGKLAHRIASIGAAAGNWYRCAGAAAAPIDPDKARLAEGVMVANGVSPVTKQ